MEEKITNSLMSFFQRINSYIPSSNLILPIGIMAILFFLLIPIPTWLLDISFSMSIMLSVLVLMVVIFVKTPIELTSFPTILLIITMLRLALNVASTRLILSHGNEGSDAAGKIIHAFGVFVVQGNYVIGSIIFSILIIINFIVLTKGAGRIAEVAARFALDAMPGKQMAIDADLSAGYINEQEAKKRRESLTKESSFYGAMDGASKFVRGDATAGILITLINVIGGMIIGVAQNDLTFSQAAHNYTILTIGDGLVTQIPALIVSTAAGILVTKSGISGETQSTILREFSGYSGALFIAGVLLILMGIIPTMPLFPFFMASSLCLGTGYYIYRNEKKIKKQEMETIESSQKQDLSHVQPPEHTISSALQMDRICIELGYNLLELLSDMAEFKLTDQVKSLRRKLASDMGFIIPAVRIQDNLQLPENTYLIRVKEIEEGRGDLYVDKFLLINPTGENIPDVHGEITKDPTFGMSAMWISSEYKDQALYNGYTVVDSATVLMTHLTEIIKKNMPDLLSYGETQKLLNELPEQDKRIADYLIPDKVNVGIIQRILQALLEEQVSIRDLPTILEGVLDIYAYTSNLTTIIEHVRKKLARQISHSHINNKGVIPAIVLAPEFEEIFRAHTVQTQDNIQLNLPPTRIREFIQKVQESFSTFTINDIEDPVMLVSPDIRHVVRSVIEKFRPQTIVLSQAEIYPTIRVETVFVIELNEE